MPLNCYALATLVNCLVNGRPELAGQNCAGAPHNFVRSSRPGHTTSRKLNVLHRLIPIIQRFCQSLSKVVPLFNQLLLLQLSQSDNNLVIIWCGISATNLSIPNMKDLYIMRGCYTFTHSLGT